MPGASFRDELRAWQQAAANAFWRLELELENTMNRLPMLRVKVKTLAAEARMIRREERRCPNQREDLTYHRKVVVRRAARHALLAYGYLRGRTYGQMESSPRTPPQWGFVRREVARFSRPEGQQLSDAERDKLTKALDEWSRGQ